MPTWLVDRGPSRVVALAVSAMFAACGEDAMAPSVPTAVVLSPERVELASLGATDTVTAAVVDQYGSAMNEAPVSWSVLDAGVAVVGRGGVVTAHGNGTTTLVAASGGARSEIPVIVRQIPESVTLTPSLDTVWTTGSRTFTVSAVDARMNPLDRPEVTWTSDDPLVASVAAGVATGVGEGATTLRATIEGREATATVIVRDLVAPDLILVPAGPQVGLKWARVDGERRGTILVRRDTVPGVTESSPVIAHLVDTLSADSTWIRDPSTRFNATYHYRAFLRSDDGATVASPEVSAATHAGSELGAAGFDMAVDDANGVVYVSLPDAREVAVVSQATAQVIDRIELDHPPRGIDLSYDGATLYVALNGAGSVLALDLEGGAGTEIALADSLGFRGTWDVAEGPPGRIFVSSNPNSGASAWIVMVDRRAGDQYRRVASSRIIRGAPVFEVAPDRSAIYVGEGFRPNSMYQLDATDPAAPIVLEDEHGSVSGTWALAISPDGSRILTHAGQVLTTDSFEEVGVIGIGVPEVSQNGAKFFSGSCEAPSSVLFEFCFVTVYDAGTFVETHSIPFAASGPTAARRSSDGKYLWSLAAEAIHRIPLGGVAGRVRAEPSR